MAAPTAILAEDEQVLRDELRQQLAGLWPELQIVGEASSAMALIVPTLVTVGASPTRLFGLRSKSTQTRPLAGGGLPPHVERSPLFCTVENSTFITLASG